MSETDLQAEIARLQAENDRLKGRSERGMILDLHRAKLQCDSVVTSGLRRKLYGGLCRLLAYSDASPTPMIVHARFNRVSQRQAF